MDRMPIPKLISWFQLPDLTLDFHSPIGEIEQKPHRLTRCHQIIDQLNLVGLDNPPQCLQFKYDRVLDNDIGGEFADDLVLIVHRD